MSFNESEKQYLFDHPLGRLATIGPSGAPMNHPVMCWLNADTGTLDIGGPNLRTSRKARNIAADPRVAIVIDDIADEPVGPGGQLGRGLEIRGHAELVAVPRPMMEDFSNEILRIWPHRIRSWNVSGPGSHDRNV